MKSNPFFLVIFLFIMSCRGKSSDQSGYLDIPMNNTYADSLLRAHDDQNIAILSFRTCDCFRQEYNKAFQLEGRKPTNYILMTDTSINRFDFPVTFLSRREMEKLSPDIYNLLLLRKTTTGIQHRIVRVGESSILEKVIADFFGK